MAWVEKHGDGFRVRYRLPDGALHSETGFTTRDVAENRAADVESDQRRDQFTDPRLARTTMGDWIQQWTDAHDVRNDTWAKYDSHETPDQHGRPTRTSTRHITQDQRAAATRAAENPSQHPDLIEALTELRRRNPAARFVFTGVDGGLHRRSNLRRRLVPRIGQGVPGIYSHVTRKMIDAMLTREERFGSTIWDDHYPDAHVVKIACSHTAPTDGKRPADEDRQQAV
jgi:hypothetical protein